MAETHNIQNVRETTTRVGDTVQKTTEVDGPRAQDDDVQTMASRIVWFATWVLMVLLAFRFMLSLFGANTGNGFANFIYSVSHPFVAPFFSLFNYSSYPYGGIATFEPYTLVAMLVYAIAAWGIVALINLNRR